MRILSCVAAAIVLATASFAASADDRDADSWPTLGRDWKQSYYSPLTGINADNIAQLGYAWGYDLQFTSTLEATPIVIDGVMYTSGNGGRTYALDAATGALRWKFEPTLDSKIDYEGAGYGFVNRGVAVSQGKVFVGAADGWLLGRRLQHAFL